MPARQAPGTGTPPRPLCRRVSTRGRTGPGAPGPGGAGGGAPSLSGGSGSAPHRAGGAGGGGGGALPARAPQIRGVCCPRPADTEITLRGGWLHTGDLARRDASGFFYIVDRAKDVIITGGYNVYPAEVEEVLQSHPDVALCASFGVPDQVKGEKPWAAIVPRAGAQLDEAALEKYCRQYLAPYKVPRRFLLVDALPRSPVGKILRRELRAQFGAGAEAAQAPLPSATAGSP